MSYLQRTGNSRNNISWTNTSNNSIKYLHRTGNNRTNIKWSTISTSANILQRTGTSRNKIRRNDYELFNLFPDNAKKGIISR